MKLEVEPMYYELIISTKSNPKSKNYDRVVYEYYTDIINEVMIEFYRLRDEYPKSHAIVSYAYGTIIEDWTE